MAESTLVEEADAAGFTMEQIRLAEDELSSPASSSTMISAKPREDSLSSKILQLLWVANRQKKIKPWSGLLPPLRQSPLRTLGDAMAKAKVTPSKKGLKLYAMKDCHRECNLLFAREASRLDPARNSYGNGSGKDASWSCSGEWQFQPPTTSTVKLLPHSTGATCKGTSNSKLGRSGVIKEAQPNDVLFHKGHRTMRTGLEYMLRKLKIGYTPAPGLVTLFSRIGTCRQNPKSSHRPTTPSNQTLLDH
jgi:hypothetical protein